MSQDSLETFSTPEIADIESLPAKQREVLAQILDFIRENAYSPSIQQLCQRCGVTSTSTIHYHLSALKKKGFIHWNPAEKRALSLRGDLMDELLENRFRASREHETHSHALPMLGTIAAGQPLQTIADSVEQIDLTQDLYPPGCYALKVRGWSMVEDHILDGDTVIINPKSSIRDGDVVVALVENETATLKRIYRERDGRVRLQPANSEMSPIYVTDVQVQGKVEAIVRKID